ncbi:MAG TPA: tetratricopeptide repeat protein [Syntrophorhabdaceae bacterium]|nr:tetratricopeptide repeat protein [Syntrophorhabdaceae bacterium]
MMRLNLFIRQKRLYSVSLRSARGVAKTVRFVLAIAVFLLVFTPMAKADILSSSNDEILKELLDAYALHENNYWSLVNRNKEDIDASIIERIIGAGMKNRDDKLIALGLQTARIKDDQKTLADESLRVADYYLLTSNNQEALKLYDGAIAVFRAIGDSIGQAKAYEGTGDIALTSSNNEEAALMYNKALDLYMYADSFAGQGSVYRKLGDISLYTGDNQKADSLYRRATGLSFKQEDLSVEGALYRGIGDMSFRKRDYKNALTAYNKAFIYYSHAQDTLGQADIYRSLGEIEIEGGDTEKAKSLFDKALPAYLDANYLIGQGNIQMDLAQVSARKLDNVEALGFCEKALSFYTRAQYPRGVARAVTRMGQIQAMTGSLDQAKISYEKAFALYQRIKEPAGQADVYWGMGDIAYETGDVSEAFQMYGKALPLYEKVDDTLGQANLYRAVGDVYLSREDNAHAAEFYEKALSLHAKANSPGEEADALKSVARVYLRTGEDTRAAEALSKALPIYQRLKEPRGEIAIYLAMGDIDQRKKEYAEALSQYEQALAVIGASPFPLERGEVHESMGDTLSLTDNPQGALEQYDKSLLFYGEAGDGRGEAQVLFKKASILKKQGMIAEAIGTYDRGFTQLETARSRSVFPEMKRRDYERLTRYYEDAIACLIRNNDYPRAFRYVEAMKADALADRLSRTGADIQSGIDDSLRQGVRTAEINLLTLNQRIRWELSKPSLNESLVRSLKSEYSAAVDKHDSIKRMILYKAPRYGSIRYRTPITLSVLQEQILGEQEVVLEYFFADSAAYCFVIGKRKHDLVRLPVDESGLREEVTAALNNIKGYLRGVPLNTRILSRLYADLVEPIKASLENKTVIVIPHGALTYLPFEALVTEGPEKPSFMVEKYPIRYVQSATTLQDLRTEYKIRATTESFVGFGDPAYNQEGLHPSSSEVKNGENGTRAFPPVGKGAHEQYLGSGGRLERLEASGQEVEDIERIFAKNDKITKPLLGGDASEEYAMKPDMENYGYIHFATRGILSDTFQAIALSETQTDKDKAFLTIGNIMNSHYKAKLITISHDEAPIDNASRGDGIAEMTQALHYAGSPAVLINLWNVSPKATRALMVRFYSNIIDKRLATGEALRAAKIDLIHGNEDADNERSTMEHPFFWSSFVMYGE